MKEQKETKRTVGLQGIMAVAMVFLTIVLGQSAVRQLSGHHIFGGCISGVGAVLFFIVAVILAFDLRKALRTKKSTQEETKHES